jgi:hypothetical protein
VIDTCVMPCNILTLLFPRPMIRSAEINLAKNLGDLIVTEANTKPDNNAESQHKESKSEVEEEIASFHPVQASNESNEHSTQEKNAGNEKEEKMQELLRSLNKETSELSGHLATENKLVIEVCTSLAQIMGKLGVSFKIPPQNLPPRYQVRKAILNENGHLQLFYGKEQSSAFLAEHPPETVMAVLWTVMPELTVAARSHKKKINASSRFFEALKKELRSLAKTLAGGPQEKPNLDEKQNMNAPQTAPTTEKQG